MSTKKNQRPGSRQRIEALPAEATTSSEKDALAHGGSPPRGSYSSPTEVPPTAELQPEPRPSTASFFDESPLYWACKRIARGQCDKAEVAVLTSVFFCFLRHGVDSDEAAWTCVRNALSRPEVVLPVVVSAFAWSWRCWRGGTTLEGPPPSRSWRACRRACGVCFGTSTSARPWCPMPGSRSDHDARGGDRVRASRRRLRTGGGRAHRGRAPGSAPPSTKQPKTRSAMRWLTPS